MEEKKENKKKKQVKIGSWSPHKIIFYPTFLLSTIIILFLILGKINLFILIGCLFVSLSSFLATNYFYLQKIVLTNRQLIFYNNTTKSHTLNLINDIKEISYTNNINFLSKFVKHGHISVLTNNNELIRIFFLQDPEEIYKTILETGNKYFYEKNPHLQPPTDNETNQNDEFSEIIEDENKEL